MISVRRGEARSSGIRALSMTWSATDYLANAGGTTRDADVKRIFLIRVDGTVISRQSGSHHARTGFKNTALLPGDAIVIPIRINAVNGWKRLEELTAILSQGALTAASLAVIEK